MNTNDDDLLAALRRAENPADRRLAELLASAPGKEGCAPHGREGRTPRASDALAAFLAAAVSGVSPLTDTDDQPVAAHDTYQLEPVRLAQPPTRSSQMKPVTAFSRVLKLSLLAKIVLGATLAIGSVGAVASTTPLGHGGDDVVVASPSTEATDDSAEAPEVEVDDEREGHVALAADEAAAQVAADAARDAARAAAKAAKAAAKKAAAEKRAAAAAAAGTQNNSDDAAENDTQDGDQNEADDAAENDSDDGDQAEVDQPDQHESDDSGSDDSGSDDSGSGSGSDD